MGHLYLCSLYTIVKVSGTLQYSYWSDNTFKTPQYSTVVNTIYKYKDWTMALTESIQKTSHQNCIEDHFYKLYIKYEGELEVIISVNEKKILHKYQL